MQSTTTTRRAPQTVRQHRPCPSSPLRTWVATDPVPATGPHRAPSEQLLRTHSESPNGSSSEVLSITAAHHRLTPRWAPPIRATLRSEPALEPDADTRS